MDGTGITTMITTIIAITDIVIGMTMITMTKITNINLIETDGVIGGVIGGMIMTGTMIITTGGVIGGMIMTGTMIMTTVIIDITTENTSGEIDTLDHTDKDGGIGINGIIIMIGI